MKEFEVSVTTAMPMRYGSVIDYGHFEKYLKKNFEELLFF